MLDNFDESCQELIQAARREAAALGALEAGSEHIVLATLERGTPDAVVGVLEVAGFTAANLRSWLAARYPAPRVARRELPSISVTFTQAMSAAANLSFRTYPGRKISAAVFVYGALASAVSRQPLAEACAELAVPADRLARAVLDVVTPMDEQHPAPPPVPQNTHPGRFRFKGAGSKENLENLEAFGVELVAVAREGGFDPHVGREKEVGELLATLLRRGKHNAVLVGEPGVGKTAIVEGLAQRVAAGDVPEDLVGARILSLDAGALIAGTRARGDFEEKIIALLRLLETNPDVLLFIDEIHQMLGAGSASGGLDMANLLKPALSRGDIRVIGATTWDEYRKVFAKDAALDRRFRPVVVAPPSVADASEIVARIAPRFADHHGVLYDSDALTVVAPLAARFLTDRFLPDTAIDVLDEVAAARAMGRCRLSGEFREVADELAGARRDVLAGDNTEASATVERLEAQLRSIGAPLEAFGVVSRKDVCETVAAIAGVPVDVVDVDAAARFTALAATLSSRVFGQVEAVDAVARGVRRRRAGIGDMKRPPSFLFCGPSGVGKTETARALAEAVYGSSDALVQIDMSEYMEAHSVARLIGAPPGYVGHDDPGALTEAVKRRRSCVVLLDEIDKAHSSISDILLQVLEEGRLTDGRGKVIDFSDTIVIATCNVAGTVKQRSVGFADAGSVMSQSVLRAALERSFRPELLNRFDEIVRYVPLSPAVLRSIVDTEVVAVAARVAERGLTLVVDDGARDLLAASGTDPDLGARPVRRAVQSAVTDALVPMLLEQSGEGHGVFVTVVDGRVVARVCPDVDMPVAEREWSGV